MDEIANYDEAAKVIKNAILKSQYDAVKAAIEAISKRLDMEFPGLRGFTARNLRYMRTFYEEWAMLDAISSIANKNEDSNLEIVTSKLLETDSEYRQPGM